MVVIIFLILLITTIKYLTRSKLREKILEGRIVAVGGQ